MEPEGSLPHSQVPVTCPCPEQCSIQTWNYVLPKYHVVSWYMHKCNFIYAWIKSMAFPVPVFEKLFTNAQ